MNRILTTTSATFLQWTEAQKPFLHPAAEVMYFQNDKAAEWGQPMYHRIIYAKHERIASMLREMPDGALLFYTDADVLFFADASEVFAQAQAIMDAQQVDVVGACDPDSGLCAGFMVIRANAHTRSIFARVWENREQPHNDQIVLNFILQKHYGLFPPSAVGNYATHCKVQVWDGKPFKLLCKPSLAWHCNYVIGEQAKHNMRDMVIAEVSTF